MSPPDDTKLTIGDLLPGFVEYLSIERRFAPSTIFSYKNGIQWFIRDLGNLPAADIGMQHFISLKSRMQTRGARESRVSGVIAAVKSLLGYARDIRGIPVLKLEDVRGPRPPRREVVYLKKDELRRFLEAIPLRTWEAGPRLAGYRFRALSEVLVASGMRIGETLALNRNSIDFEHRTARVVGKGNKERTVFFTPRSLQWLTRYVDMRRDKGEALFATEAGKRIGSNGVQGMFGRITKRAGLEKHVTPHVLRHTTATLLLGKGCPMGHIKQILGHDRLETTCRYYLGILDDTDVQKAHHTYMNLDEHDVPPLTRLPEALD